MEPRIQYAKTKDGVSIAYCDSGEGTPVVSAAPSNNIEIGCRCLFPCLAAPRRCTWYTHGFVNTKTNYAAERDTVFKTL